MKTKYAKIISMILIITLTTLGIFRSTTHAKNDSSIVTPYYYIESNKRLIKTEIIKQKPVGWADGQNKNGHTFLGSSGSICWSPKNGKSVSVSLGPNYNNLSIGVSVGIAFQSGASYCNINLAPNVAWKLYTYADIEVKTYLVDYDYSGAQGTKKVYEKKL